METNAINRLSSSDIDLKLEGGTLSRSGEIRVVNLFGTWYEMGRQYGALLSGQLRHVYEFSERYVARNGEAAVNVLNDQWAQISYSLRVFMRGVSETSGLTLAQLHRANAVERLSGLPLCSFAACWGDYTGGPMVIGRNYDYGVQFLELREDVAVTVFHPADGTLATAIVGYAGEIYAVNALNEKGIFLELNTGYPSAPVYAPDDRITGTTQLLNTMFEADTFDYVDTFFNTARSREPFVINVADPTTAVSYEWCASGMLRGGGDMPRGLLISTNHYVNPAWPYPKPTDETSWMSFTRRDNLLRLVSERKGSIDAEVMRELIAVDEEHGGAANGFTVYQIVCEPGKLKMWLRVIGSTDWTELDMGSFLVDTEHRHTL